MLSGVVDKLKEELRELFRDRCTKSELMHALAATLTNFQQLRGTASEAVINEFIMRRAEDGCEIMIHDEEFRELWNTYLKST